MDRAQFGASNETRTRTGLIPGDFKSPLSTNSNIDANICSGRTRTCTTDSVGDLPPSPAYDAICELKRCPSPCLPISTLNKIIILLIIYSISQTIKLIAEFTFSQNRFRNFIFTHTMSERSIPGSSQSFSESFIFTKCIVCSC